MSRESSVLGSIGHVVVLFAALTLGVYFGNKYWRGDGSEKAVQPEAPAADVSSTEEPYKNSAGQYVDFVSRAAIGKWLDEHREGRRITSLAYCASGIAVISEDLVSTRGVVPPPEVEDRFVKPPASNATENASINVYFSPKGGCTAAIVNEINTAKKSVLVLSYSFTSDPILDALVAAKKRGVDVQLVIDKGSISDTGCDAQKLSVSAPVFVDAAHKIQHQKVMIIDVGLPTAEVITGSFNFSKNAEESNSENVLIIRSKKTVDLYKANWDIHRQHSTPLVVQ